ncbi:MAG: hypothetical protein PWQ48_1878 [Thermotogaceae bacterium]|jgi:hypothetical protein|nr:hypothetical protein [Thermotogaceae bacterium]MDI3501744.1 hypothetical protein [Thermoanaerobacter sp.]
MDFLLDQILHRKNPLNAVIDSFGNANKHFDVLRIFLDGTIRSDKR